MALNTLNTDAISFKKLGGKAHTQQNFAITEEGKTTNVQSSFSTVFANKIEPLPVTNSGLTAIYSTNGIVERVKFQVDIIPDTQIAVGRSQGYRLKLPSDYNASGELFPEFSAGTYLHNALGKLQIVPSLYGGLKVDGSTEYDPILYQTNGSTVIAKFDPINWYIDPYNGVLFIQDPPIGYDSNAARPGFVEAFLYVGDYLDDIIFSIASGSTGTTAQNIGGGEGIFKDNIYVSGTSVLRLKSLVGVNGIAVTGDTDNVIIYYTGSTASTTTANNGLTKIGDNIVLGGLLTGDTKINADVYTFHIAQSGGTGSVFIESKGGIILDNTNSNYSIDLNSDSGNDINVNADASNIRISGTSNGNILLSSEGYNFGNYKTSQIINPTGVTFSSYNDAESPTTTSIILSGSTILINSDNSDFAGIQYGGDYSSDYTARSIPDVGFVTGLTPALNIYTQKVVISGNTTLTPSNFIVFCNSNASGFTITLPASPVDGQVYKIKDIGDAFTNNIVVSGNGIDVDGSSTFTINTERGGLELCYDSTLNEWFVLNFVG